MLELKNLENFGITHSESSHGLSKIYETFSIRKSRIDHPAYSEAIRKIAALHRRGRDLKQGGGLLITGHTGTGKTTALDFYRSQFPRYEENHGTASPVLYVVTPASPTVKNLAEAILVSMGDLASGRGSSEEKTRRVYKFLETCKVELLMIDEFQHFTDTARRSASRDVTDWLKNLLSVAHIPVVLAGLPRCDQVIRGNQQLSRRFSSRYNLRPFPYDTPAKQMEFRGVLKLIQQSIPVKCVPLHDANNARMIFVASNGVIDYVAKLIDQAVELARQSSEGEISLDIFAQAFEDEIWRDCPDSLNPFRPGSICRLLTRIGEPFESHDDPMKRSTGSRTRR